jgi:hypothetical protein
MKISSYNPTENPEEWRSWEINKTADELEARQLFAELNGPGKSFTVSSDEEKSPSLWLNQYKHDEWEVTLWDVIEKTIRMGTVTRQQADRLIEAVYRKENLVSVTNQSGVNWTDIPEEFPTDRIFLHPGCSRIEADGKIIMKAGGSGERGIWDGSTYFNPSQPDYDFWHWLVTSEKWSSNNQPIDNELISRLKKEFAQSNTPP